MKMYDVVAVNKETQEKRTLATNKTAYNADAIVNMAVYRRGVDIEFFKKVPHVNRRQNERLRTQSD